MIKIYKEYRLYTVKHNIAAAINKISESNATEIVNYMICVTAQCALAVCF